MTRPRSLDCRCCSLSASTVENCVVNSLGRFSDMAFPPEKVERRRSCPCERARGPSNFQPCPCGGRHSRFWPCPCGGLYARVVIGGEGAPPFFKVQRTGLFLADVARQFADFSAFIGRHIFVGDL